MFLPWYITKHIWLTYTSWVIRLMHDYWSCEFEINILFYIQNISYVMRVEFISSTMLALVPNDSHNGHCVTVALASWRLTLMPLPFHQDVVEESLKGVRWLLFFVAANAEQSYIFRYAHCQLFTKIFKQAHLRISMLQITPYQNHIHSLYIWRHPRNISKLHKFQVSIPHEENFQCNVSHFSLCSLSSVLKTKFIVMVRIRR